MSRTTNVESVPIVDLGAEYREMRAEIDEAVHRVLAGGIYVMGKEGEQFEKELAAYCAAPHAVGVNSGTDAILLALRALDVGPGDEVLVPAMTFIATAEPVSQLGARPVFVDIDPAAFTMDPAKAARAVTPRTRAILAVHLYGQTADMEALAALARERGLPLIEDMAQAIGAEFRGRRAGSLGDLACLSFFPTKNLGACGDAGAVLTGRADLARRIRRLRDHGAPMKYQHDEVGYNTRLDELQAAILRIKLRRLDAVNERRRALAAAYSKALEGLPLSRPQEAAGRRHVYHLYSVQSARRDALKDFLSLRRIGTGVHYPTPLHLQKAYAPLGYKAGDFPVGEKLARETLSLPLFPQMTELQQDYVASAVREFFESGGAA